MLRPSSGATAGLRGVRRPNGFTGLSATATRSRGALGPTPCRLRRANAVKPTSHFRVRGSDIGQLGDSINDRIHVRNVATFNDGDDVRTAKEGIGLNDAGDPAHLGKSPFWMSRSDEDVCPSFHCLLQRQCSLFSFQRPGVSIYITGSRSPTDFYHRTVLFVIVGTKLD